MKVKIEINSNGEDDARFQDITVGYDPCKHYAH